MNVRRVHHHRAWLWVLLGVIAGLAGCRAGSPSPSYQGPPNVLLITLDTHRADFFGANRDSLRTTPHFDALAKDGIHFEQAYSTSGCTPPAHASILTGLFPYHHGVRVIYAGGGYRLSTETPTLTTILKGSRYRTAAFLSSFTVSEFFGFNHGFDLFDNGLAESADALVKVKGKRSSWNKKVNQRRADETTDRFLEWLPTGSGPFFSWIHYWDPHDQALKPPESVVEHVRNMGKWKRGRRLMYAAEINFVDQQFGRVIAALKERGLYEHTLIAIIADHGEGLGDHRWVGHRLLYQEQIRVPFFLRIPGGPQKVRVDKLVRNVDLLPTLLAELKMPLPAKLDGSPLQPVWNGTESEERTAYAEQLNKWDYDASMVNRRRKDDLLHAVVQDGWKLIFKPTQVHESELYHLKEDPREKRNLYRDEPERVAILSRNLDQRSCFREEPFPAPVPTADVLERLGALGYIEGAPETDGDGEPTVPSPVKVPAAGEISPMIKARPADEKSHFTTAPPGEGAPVKVPAAGEISPMIKARPADEKSHFRAAPPGERAP